MPSTLGPLGAFFGSGAAQAARFSDCNTGRHGEQLQDLKGIHVAAFATYFPEIANCICMEDLKPDNTHMSGMMTPRSLAQQALANMIVLGLQLRDAYPGLFPNVIVEVVCGTRMDLCGCSQCRNKGDGFVFVADKSHRLSQFLHSLVRVVRRVRDLRPTGRSDEWVVAIELEPGETYLVNQISTMVELDQLLRQPEFEALRGHVGFNVDIAHMRMANVHPSALKQISSRIVHAHIGDHPEMHTRDQSFGTWTPIYRLEAEDYAYLAVLDDVLTAPADVLPRSGAVELELEGCSKLGWLHESLSAMTHRFHAIRGCRNTIRQIHQV